MEITIGERTAVELLLHRQDLAAKKHLE